MNCDELEAAIEDLQQDLTDIHWDLALHTGELLLGFGGFVISVIGEVPSVGTSTAGVYLSLGVMVHADLQIYNDTRKGDILYDELDALCALWDAQDC